MPRAIQLGNDPLHAWCISLVVFQRYLFETLKIWKAGGAFVSMNPKLPAERLKYMTEVTKMKVVVTLSHLEQLFQFQDGPKLSIIVLLLCGRSFDAARISTYG